MSKIVRPIALCCLLGSWVLVPGQCSRAAPPAREDPVATGGQPIIVTRESGTGQITSADGGYAEWSKRVKYNKSWIAIDWSALNRPLVEGDRVIVPVEYFLDPADHYLATTLKIEALGPRVPKAGARKPVSFENTQHLWYGEQSVKIEPGTGKHAFALTIPRSSPQNDLLLLALFADSQGKRWPWDVRASTWFSRKGGFFELETDRPGNLFTYDEPVRVVARLKNVRPAAKGESKMLRYRVYDYTRALLGEGSVPFTVERDGQSVPVPLNIARRGTFLFQAEVEGWESRETMFCRIPNLAALTNGKPTRLGFTIHAAPALGSRTDQVFQIARCLGLTTCRAFTEWKSIEPGPGVFALSHWDPSVNAASAHGIETVITIYDPPAWVMPVGRHVGYQMFPCRLDAFREMVTTVSRRYREKIWGWEWLNEITPGGTPDYVTDYVKLCEAGVLSARAVDPKLKSVLAGGLWPRGFRLDVLSAGAGRFVDVLPIHYGSGAAIAEARADLDSYGHSRAGVWENESCAFVIDWNCPGLDWVSETSKCRYILTQWTDELNAGAEKLIYFGGEGAAIGYGDYMLSDFSPLPVAATLAVFAAKTFDARPIGMFQVPGSVGVFHLFERNGQALLVAPGRVNEGDRVPLAVGSPTIRLTDYQGNETTVASADGVARLPLLLLPCFVEGAELDVLKSYLVPAIDVGTAGAGASRNQAAAQIHLLVGKPGTIPVRLQNLYSKPLSGTLQIELPASWTRDPRLRFSLGPNERKTVAIPVTVPESTRLQTTAHQLTATFDWQKLPPVTKSMAITLISPERVGNLIKNGGFEELNRDGKTPAHWNGINARIVSSEGLGLGLGKNVLKFSNASQYAYHAQSIKLPGSTTYLYTAWVWNQGMEGGSNINQTMTDGRSRALYNNAVINIGDSTPSWQVFTCRYDAPQNLAEAAFVPVVRGAGSALFDNIRVTFFEGTDFAAETIRVGRPPAIDGRLDDWDGRCPIPLIGRNQLHMHTKEYAWGPKNLSGVVYLRWDAGNLYVAIEVSDDVHHPAGDGDTVVTGDSVILAFDPTGRSPEASSRSSEFYLSAQKPAGGSGMHTLWRPHAKTQAARQDTWRATHRRTSLRSRPRPASASTSCAFRGASWGSLRPSAASSASPLN